MKKYLMTFYVLTLLTMCGCTQIVSQTYGVAVDEREVSTIASDEKIKVTIQKGFLEDSTIKILDISPFCYDSHVYLVGEYETVKEKERASEIVNDVQGVKSVTTYLRRKKKDDSCGITNNLTIDAKVKTKLIGDKDIMSTNIDVKVVQCNVVLLGIVGSGKEISKAIAHAKSVESVRSVISYLKSTN